MKTKTTKRSPTKTMSSKAQKISRRSAVTRAGVLVGAALASGARATAAAESKPTAAKKIGGFVLCLNTATIRGQKLGIVKEIEVAAKAGYQAIEPWVSAIEAYQKEGGSLPELKRRIADAGLTVESAIGFPPWIVDDDAKRAQGLERAKVEMDLVAQIGGKRLAAPPSGATDLPKLDLLKAAERYRALLEAGDRIGVVPQLELWGFSKNLNRLGECACVAIEANHPKACVLADVYHIYERPAVGVADRARLLRVTRTVAAFNPRTTHPPGIPLSSRRPRRLNGDGPWHTDLAGIRNDQNGSTGLALRPGHFAGRH